MLKEPLPELVLVARVREVCDDVDERVVPAWEDEEIPPAAVRGSDAARAGYAGAEPVELGAAVQFRGVEETAERGALAWQCYLSISKHAGADRGLGISMSFL